MSYPVAAEWLTGTLILASYDQAHEPGCGRRRTACGVVLLDTAAAVDFIPYVGRPRICRGTTTAGRPCRAFPPPGSGFCHWHDPARVAR